MPDTTPESLHMVKLSDIPLYGEFISMENVAYQRVPESRDVFGPYNAMPIDPGRGVRWFHPDEMVRPARSE